MRSRSVVTILGFISLYFFSLQTAQWYTDRYRSDGFNKLKNGCFQFYWLWDFWMHLVVLRKWQNLKNVCRPCRTPSCILTSKSSFTRCSKAYGKNVKKLQKRLLKRLQKKGRDRKNHLNRSNRVRNLKTMTWRSSLIPSQDSNFHTPQQRRVCRRIVTITLWWHTIKGTRRRQIVIPAATVVLS
jgi:hypothetical protein